MTDRIAAPMLHCTAVHDRITPAETAPAGPAADLDAGHVGMIVGSRRHELHSALGRFLDPLAARARHG